jgi:hypothetical protein
VYSGYSTADGSLLDEGSVWATVDGIRATTNEEGVLGLVVAPDFAVSKTVYVYVTTMGDDANQEIRAYRENGAGVGEYAGHGEERPRAAGRIRVTQRWRARGRCRRVRVCGRRGQRRLQPLECPDS